MSFVRRNMPPGDSPLMLDLCNGPGRHAQRIREAGYRIVSLDRNRYVLQRAPKGPCYVVGGLHAVPARSERYDAVVNLWHSFGYSDDEGNEAVLRDVMRLLRPGGRALFDIYNRDHLRDWPTEDGQVRSGLHFRTVREWRGNRLRVTLTYDGGEQDQFDWRLYTPGEFVALSERAGFEVLNCSASFDESVPASRDFARMQVVLERPQRV